MVNKSVEKVASPVDTQGDAEGGENPGGHDRVRSPATKSRGRYQVSGDCSE